MAAPRWASLDRSCDQYGIKLRADHGGSSPGGVLERAARPQPSIQELHHLRRGAPKHLKHARGDVLTSCPLILAGAYFAATSSRLAGAVLAKAA